jgi:hypothetical protein
METKQIISWLLDKAARAQDHSYARMLNQAAKRLKELDQEQKWIPVSERLPECDGRYLCNVKSFSFPGTFYRTILQYVDGGFVEGHIYTDDVTHWMPLPEPPKEVE